jgi:hypothetical protein
MTRRDDVPSVMREFAETIRTAHAADDPVTADQEDGPEGTEPAVIVRVAGVAIFHFRRDEFLDAVYVAGCDVLEELERDGLPLAVSTGAPS